MRIYDQGVWLVCVAVFAVLVVAGVIYLAVEKGWRSASWPRERARRAGWSKEVAQVESWTRVTEVGDFQIVLSLVSSELVETYRSTIGRVRLRGMARLSARAVTHMESTKLLPVRFSLPEIVIDLAEVDADNAEAIDREMFLERGTPKWKVVTDS